MSKCRNCRIEILDNTDRCPLCHSALEKSPVPESMYPDVISPARKLALASRIYLCAIVLESLLVGLNVIILKHEFLWSVFPGIALLYVYLLLRYALLGKNGYRGKAFMLTLTAVLMAVAADFATGYRGWSVDYVLSSSIIGIDVAIIILMIYNRRNWQSYVMWQILMILLSMIPAVLYVIGIENNANMAFLPAVISVFLFLGTLMIGGRRAWQEVYRRFHIN